MAKLWILLRDKFFNNIIKIIGWILLFIAVIIFPYLSVPIKNFVNIIPNILLIAIALLFIILGFIELTYIVYLKEEKKKIDLNQLAIKEDKFKEWEHIDKYGIWKKGETYYCPNCKTKDIESPLQVFDTGWQCLVKDCLQIYRNEKYKPGPIIKTVGRRRHWTDDY